MMSTRRSMIHVLTIVMMVATALVAGPAVPEEGALPVAIISGQDAGPYRQVVDGFIQRFKEIRPDARIEHHFLGGDIAKTERALQELRRHRPHLLFTLGSNTTKRIVEEFPTSLTLASMIVNGDVLDESSRASGILLRATPSTQLEWLSRFLPRARRVAVLYDPNQSRAWVEELNLRARAMNLEVITLPVTSPQELPPALKKVGRQADVLLGIPDSTVYSGKTAEGILLSSFRNRIPFVGLSSAWVKAGALYALDWDYRELGRQGAETAHRMLENPDSRIGHTTPAKILYSVNLKTVEHMGVDLDPSLISGASLVFE